MNWGIVAFICMVAAVVALGFLIGIADDIDYVGTREHLGKERKECEK